MARKKPDRLAEEAAQARAAGMTYGKWKAMQIPAEITPPEKRKCEYCGREFVLRQNQNRKYCDVVCKQNAGQIRAQRRAKERKVQNEMHKV